MSDARPKVYLLDVEGTVAPLSLTSEVLFPYARAHFWKLLRGNLDDPAVRSDLRLLSEENEADSEPDAPRIPKVHWTDFVDSPLFLSKALVYLLWLMDRDRKSTALKGLQGKIWNAGFENGELKGTLFDDVPEAFKNWTAEARVAIYSSGSVEAQKLLFRHSIFGDLTSWITAYFDTRTGPKMQSASYTEIAAAMQVAPEELLFLSDSVRELDAAREAGCQTRLVVRPGNAPVEESHEHAVVESLAGL